MKTHGQLTIALVRPVPAAAKTPGHYEMAAGHDDSSLSESGVVTMKTYTKDELAKVLQDHNAWVNSRWSGAVKGSRADLTGADLTGAVLRDADLRGAVLRDAVLRDAVLRDAVLRDADLTGADLTGADLTGAVLTDGYTRWEQYKKEVVPALCVAGGKSLDDVANPETWGCHRWCDRENEAVKFSCPMAVAFNAEGIAQIPALYRQLATDFIQYFDADLIPLGEVNPKYAEQETPRG